MRRHGTVEMFGSFDVHDLHRAGVLREPQVSLPWVPFQWPRPVSLVIANVLI